jgi:hypothetical protein
VEEDLALVNHWKLAGVEESPRGNYSQGDGQRQSYASGTSSILLSLCYSVAAAEHIINVTKPNLFEQYQAILDRTSTVIGLSGNFAHDPVMSRYIKLKKKVQLSSTLSKTSARNISAPSKRFVLSVLPKAMHARAACASRHLSTWSANRTK